MKAIVDTNVVVSGLLFGGIPRRVLEEAQLGSYTLVISHEILDEYVEVMTRVSAEYGLSWPMGALESVIAVSELTFSVALPQAVSADSSDDKFIAAAVAAKAEVIVSGDKHLKSVSGWSGISVLSPAAFLKRIQKGD